MMKPKRQKSITLHHLLTPVCQEMCAHTVESGKATKFHQYFLGVYM